METADGRRSTLGRARPPTQAPAATTGPAVGRGWATLMLISLSLHVPGLGLVPVGAVVALWRWRAVQDALRRTKFRPARWLIPATAAALISGALLRLAIAGDSTGTLGPVRPAVEVGLWLVAFPLMALGGFLAIQVLGIPAAAWRLGLGALIGGVAYVGLDVSNPWKFVLAYPVGLLLFWAVSRAQTSFPALLACGLLVVVSTANATRNTAGAAALTAVLLVVFSRRSDASRSAGRRLFALSAAGITGVTALLYAMQTGWLGREMAEQYARQTVGGQNVFLGGRVEWNVTATLFEARPLGFGLGTNPSLGLQNDAVRAVARAGGDPNREYYNFAVFGDRVDVHSIAGNLWFHAGIGGLLLVAAIGAALAWGAVSASLSPAWSPGARAFLFFAVAQAAWDLLFSPMAQIDHVTIGLAVSMMAASSAAPSIPAAPDSGERNESEA